MRRRHDIRSSSLSGWIGFLAALAFYVTSLLPGVAFWDTGEMQTVPYLPGIAHPTGFPLFVLGGWLFSHLVPFGAPAWRLSLFSALAGAGAAGMLAVFVTDIAGGANAGIGGGALVGIGAAIVFALGDVAWTRGVRAEVHDLALLCVAAAVTAAARAGRDGSPRALGIAALACGLGAAAHPVALLAIPAVLVLAWPPLAAAGRRGRTAAAALAFAPLALYAYVPLRSAYVEAHGLDPAAALGVAGGAIWDDDAPSNPASFARYVTGAAFDPARSLRLDATPRGVARLRNLGLATAYREYSPLVLTFALTGLLYLALHRPRAAVGLLSICALDVAFVANFAAESDASRYLLGGLWAVAACAGVGAWWLATALAGDARPSFAVALAAALLLVGLWPNAPAAAFDVAHERRLEDARAFVASVERLAVPGSLVIASWNFATPLAYDAYVARTLRLRLVCGWPLDERTHFAAWRARFAHVYVVVPTGYGVEPFARRIFATAQYQIAELRP
jgi:hypothetical protein